MGISLRDQLLKAGLVDKKQVKKARHEQRAGKKKNKGKKTPEKINQTQQERLAQEKRNHELNLQRKKEKLRLENLAQVKQLVKTNCLKLDDYEEPYYFKVGKKIKKLYVSEKIIDKLSAGLLAIVKFDGRFEIVPASVADQIIDRDTDTLVIRHEPEE